MTPKQAKFGRRVYIYIYKHRPNYGFAIRHLGKGNSLEYGMINIPANAPISAFSQHKVSLWRAVSLITRETCHGPRWPTGKTLPWMSGWVSPFGRDPQRHLGQGKPELCIVIRASGVPGKSLIKCLGSGQLPARAGRDMPWSPVTNWQNPALDVGVGFSLWERPTTTSRARQTRALHRHRASEVPGSLRGRDNSRPGLAGPNHCQWAWWCRNPRVRICDA